MSIAEDHMTEMVDLRLAHDVYMDRAIKEFTRRLHGPVVKWAGQVAEGIAKRWPYSGGLTESELEELAQPVKYDRLNSMLRFSERESRMLAERLHGVVTEYLRRLAVHEYKFQQAATQIYATLPGDVSEAEQWEESLEGAIPELKPFPDFERHMGKIPPPPDRIVNAALQSPTSWDGKPWSERLPYLQKSFGSKGRSAIRGDIITMMQNGEPINKIRSEVKRSLGDGFKHKANIVTRTETARVQNVLKDSQYEAGAKQGLYAAKQASAVFDKRTCVECGGYDGNKYYYDDRDPSVESAPIFPVHAFCRCMYIPIPSYADKNNISMGTRGTAEFGQIEGDFENWMRRMNQRDSDFARNWMGEEKYKEWSQGRKTLEELAGSSKPSAQLAMSRLSGLEDDMKPPPSRENEFTQSRESP